MPHVRNHAAKFVIKRISDTLGSYLTLIQDAFTDTNGTLLTAHTIAPVNIPAAAWAAPGFTTDASAQVQTNRCHNAANVNKSNILTTNFANVRVSMDVNVAASAGNEILYILLRQTDGNNLWFLGFGFTTGTVKTMFIGEWNAGVNTTRASLVPVFNTGVTYQLIAEVKGNLIRFTRGSDVLTYSSAFNNTAVKHGLRIVSFTGNSWIDNWKLEK